MFTKLKKSWKLGEISRKKAIFWTNMSFWTMSYLMQRNMRFQDNFSRISKNFQTAHAQMFTHSRKFENVYIKCLQICIQMLTNVYNCKQISFGCLQNMIKSILNASIVAYYSNNFQKA